MWVFLLGTLNKRAIGINYFLIHIMFIQGSSQGLSTMFLDVFVFNWFIIMLYNIISMHTRLIVFFVLRWGNKASLGIILDRHAVLPGFLGDNVDLLAR